MVNQHQKTASENATSKRRLSEDRIHTLTNITNRPKRNCRRISNFRTLEIQEAFENIEIMEPPPPKLRRSEKEPAVVDFDTEFESFKSDLIKILGTHYFDLMDRLQLEAPPKCMLYVKTCSKQHSKNNIPKVCDLSFQAQNVCERPVPFLHAISAMILRNEFPGDNIILSLFELILTVKKSTNQLLTESLNILNDLLIKFPPCWPAVKGQYLSILSNKISLDSEFISEKYNKDLGIMMFLVDTLEFLIENPDTGERKEKRKGLADTDESDEIAINFFLWEVQQLSKNNFIFDKFSREEKLNRIFMILYNLVDLLEKDLVMWIMKHPMNVSANIENMRKRPLIAHVVWPDAQEVGKLNAFVKKIIKIFLNAVLLKFPENSIAILGRFFNLVAIAINLSENQYNNDIVYPFVKSKSEMFVKELGKQVESSSYYSVDNVLLLIDSIRTPYVKMLLVDHISNKLYPHRGTPSVHKYWQNFNGKLWLAYAPVTSPNTPTPCDSPSDSTHAQSEKYPILAEERWIIKKLAFDQKQYLQLLFVGLKSYFKVYRVNDLIKVKSISDGQLTAAAATTTTTNNPKPDISLPAVPSIVFTHLTVDVNVMLYYRDELKYFVLLRKLISDFKVQYGAIFDELDEFMKFCKDI